MTTLPRPEAGTVFGGDFKIVRPLKEGGMGAVYVAEQLSTGALRALKLMNPQHAQDEAMRRRFEQEARASARIQSDYVVDVVAAGVDAASGTPWIAMELLEGEDLGDHMKRLDRLSPRDTLEILRMLCHAVAAAHDAGLVHRDLKPENVFLARSKRPGEAFTLKVLDFGIARPADLQASSTAALGTPLWMAPEQTARGPRIAPQTDVWAIGLIAFYLLTGSWYWRTPHEESPSITEFLRELTLEPLEPASVRAASLGLPSLPPGFDAWFARCVVRDTSARFANGREAFAAIEPVLAWEGTGDIGTGATVPVTPGMVAPAPQARPARPFFVGTETEKALAAGSAPTAPAPPLARANVPMAPPVTAPGTAVTGDAAAPRQGSGPSRWLVVVLAGAVFGGGGAWLLMRSQHEPGVRSPPPPSIGSAMMTFTPVADAGAGVAASDEVARAAAQEVAKESSMVTLPGAVFQLGYSQGAIDERPVHPVSFTTFRLQVAEVTVAQYARCVAVGRCTPAGNEEHCTANRPGGEHMPITCVSLAQATAYCTWLGRRLPTEDEWEYAASGNAKRIYAWGNTPPAGRACIGRPDAGPCDVGSFDAGATPEGLLDMTGNVEEWTTSDYCMYDGSPCAHDQKVARGGGWFSGDPNVVRTQVRQGFPPAAQSASVGFRCARSL